MKRRLVLLDFDGTLTTGDTLLVFIKYYRGALSFAAGFAMLSPWLVAMKFKLVSNQAVKEMVLAWFFRGEDEKHFNTVCEKFALEEIPRLIRPGASRLIAEEHHNQANILVVSASPENWVMPWCIANNLTCLATRLEIVNGKLTGRIAGRNCYGAEKVNRINEQIVVTDYRPIYAYGDSRGDKEMLALSDFPHYKYL